MIELEATYTQTFTVRVPEFVDDKPAAEAFFWNRREEIVRDILDDRQKRLTINHIREVDE